MIRCERETLAGLSGIAALTVAVLVLPFAVQARGFGLRECAAGDLVVRVAPARDSFARGQRVSLRVTVRNTSASACSISSGSCLPQLVITGRGGVAVWNRAATRVVCEVGMGRRLSGGSTLADLVVWNGRVCTGRDPKSCPGGLAVPGRYTATASWTGSRAAASFLVTG